MRFTMPYWLSPGDDRPTRTIDSEIAEELRLHLDLLADEERRAGATPDVARQRAAERFGDLPTLQRRCRAIRQGYAPMLRRIQTAVSIAALSGLAVLGWRLHAMATVQHDLLVDIEHNRALLGALQSDQGAAPAEETEFVAKRAAAKRSDLTGVVTSTDGEPLAEADVLLIVKTWPNNRYRQDDFAVKTNKEGRFTLRKKIPLDGQYGVNAAVIAKGHAIASQYVLVEEPAGEEPDELRFALVKTKPTRLLITDQSGKPLSKALVVPSARFTEDDDEFLVYFQGSKPAWKKTDAEGVVEVDWFVPGDLGKVSVRPRGGDLQERKFDVDETRSVNIAVED